LEVCFLKKTLLWIVSLLLCLTCLTSCADLKVQQSVNKLDELQARLEQDGYECTRWQDTEVASYAESLASFWGVLLKGEITGVIEYTYRDEAAGKQVYGIVLGTTCKADARAVCKAHTASLADAVSGLEATVQTYYVQIEYTLR
jgi:hypothetical protein